MIKDNVAAICAVLPRLIESGTDRQYYVFLHRYHDADIADALMTLSPEQRIQFFLKVNPELAVEVLEEMDLDYQVQLITQVKVELAAIYIEEMEPDDAVDLLEELIEEDEQRAEEIMGALPQEDMAEIQQLLSFKEDSAGAIMTSAYLWIPENLYVQDAITSIKDQNPPDSEVSFYVFIVNDARQLVGMTSIRNLLLADDTQYVKDVRNSDPIHVDADMDQEQVAGIFRKYDLVVLPVVDNQQCLIGIITVDDIVDVVVEEATEDMYKLSGAGTSDMGESRLLHGRMRYAVWSRIPWLLVTVLGGIMASFVMLRYADYFPKTARFPLALSVSFVPLLMGLGGNIGNQSATIVVRGLSTGVLKRISGWQIVRRELTVGACIGGCISLAVSLITLSMGYAVIFSVILGLSIWINSIVAACLGAALPILLRMLKVDPAVASAPFISTALDVIGQVIYYGVTIGLIMCLIGI